MRSTRTMDCINNPSANLGLLNLLPKPSSSVEVCWTMKLRWKTVTLVKVFSCFSMLGACEFGKCRRSKIHPYANRIVLFFKLPLFKRPLFQEHRDTTFVGKRASVIIGILGPFLHAVLMWPVELLLKIEPAALSDFTVPLTLMVELSCSWHHYLHSRRQGTQIQIYPFLTHSFRYIDREGERERLKMRSVWVLDYKRQ